MNCTSATKKTKAKKQAKNQIKELPLYFIFHNPQSLKRDEQAFDLTFFDKKTKSPSTQSNSY